jgi:hypothetical protein
MIVAHVGGVPVEELLPSAGSVGAGLRLARAWLRSRLRRQETPNGDTHAER